MPMLVAETAEQAVKPKRTRTGIEERHARSCPTHDGGRCKCKPSYRAEVWSARDKQKLRDTFTTRAAAEAWRSDTMSALRKGTMRAPARKPTEEAMTAWIDGVERG